MTSKTEHLQFLLLASLSDTNSEMPLAEAFDITSDYVDNLALGDVIRNLNNLNGAVCGACDLLDIPIGE